MQLARRALLESIPMLPVLSRVYCVRLDVMQPPQDDLVVLPVIRAPLLSPVSLLAPDA